jgi:hypothetical protein
MRAFVPIGSMCCFSLAFDVALHLRIDALGTKAPAGEPDFDISILPKRLGRS